VLDVAERRARELLALLQKIEDVLRELGDEVRLADGVLVLLTDLCLNKVGRPFLVKVPQLRLVRLQLVWLTVLVEAGALFNSLQLYIRLRPDGAGLLTSLLHSGLRVVEVYLRVLHMSFGSAVNSILVSSLHALFRALLPLGSA